MATIRINNVDGVDWIYGGNDEEWKTYVCYDFDEKIVIYGNKEYQNVTEAEWWVKAKEIIDDLDFNEADVDDMVDYYKYTKESIEAVIKEYNECRYSNNIDFIVKVANILFPGKKIKVGRLNGYRQSEWQYFAYASAEFKDDLTNLLEAYYFGKISEIEVCENDDDDNYYGVITHDELWEMERSEKGLKESLRERFEIAKDAPLKVYEANGYVQTLKWEEVEK